MSLLKFSRFVKQHKSLKQTRQNGPQPSTKTAAATNLKLSGAMQYAVAHFWQRSQFHTCH